MKETHRLGIFVTLCTLGVVGVLAILWILVLQRQPPLLYTTAFSDLKVSVVLLDLQASPCVQPRSLLDASSGNVIRARWTPRRDQIIYVLWSSESDMSSLWVMYPNGTGRRQLTPHLPAEFESMGGILLSPNQRYVALLSKYDQKDPHQWETNILDTQTATWRRIMTETWRFEWSPVQNLLATYRWSDGNLYFIQPDGTILSKFQIGLGEFTWSPDGQQMAFESDLLPDGRVSRISEVYGINLQNGKIRQLTQSAGQYESRLVDSLTWSPDGKRIAFVSNFTKPDGTGENDVLFMLEADSGDEIRLADHVRWSAPVWSPNGKQIAFVSTRDGSNYGQIYTVDVASREITQLTCYDGLKQSLSW